MRIMSRVIALLFVGVALSAVPAHAQANSSHPSSSVNWQQHDTAVYVVSTLNLLGRSHGGNIQQTLQRLNIDHIDVYADTAQTNLYFIELKRSTGSLAGSLAYQMGWSKPRRITWSSGKGIPAVASTIVQAYKTDAKTLIGTFTSTLPQ